MTQVGVLQKGKQARELREMSKVIDPYLPQHYKLALVQCLAHRKCSTKSSWKEGRSEGRRTVKVRQEGDS